MDRIALKEKLCQWLKKYRYVLLVLLAGMVLMAIPEETEEETVQTTDTAVTEPESMESRLEDILSRVEGAGKVRVLLTERTGESILYQTDGDTAEGADSSSVRTDTVIVTGS